MSGSTQDSGATTAEWDAYAPWALDATGLAARAIADGHRLEYDDAVSLARTALAASHQVIREHATAETDAAAERAIRAEASAVRQLEAEFDRVRQSVTAMRDNARQFAAMQHSPALANGFGAQDEALSAVLALLGSTGVEAAEAAEAGDQ